MYSSLSKTNATGLHNRDKFDVKVNFVFHGLRSIVQSNIFILNQQILLNKLFVVFRKNKKRYIIIGEKDTICNA